MERSREVNRCQALQIRYSQGHVLARLLTGILATVTLLNFQLKATKARNWTKKKILVCSLSEEPTSHYHHAESCSTIEVDHKGFGWIYIPGESNVTLFKSIHQCLLRWYRLQQKGIAIHVSCTRVVYTTRKPNAINLDTVGSLALSVTNSISVLIALPLWLPGTAAPGREWRQSR